MPYSFKRENIPKTAERCSFVFVSSNFYTSENLIILINGSGVVKAGQWARSLIINDSLETGSQLPYIRRCLEMKWAVLIMNTNQNNFIDSKGIFLFDF